MMRGGLFFLLVCFATLVHSQIYEVGKYRVGKSCGHYDDYRFPNAKRVSIPFLNLNFRGRSKPVVVASVQRPKEKTGYSFGVNILNVHKGGFTAEVQRLDVGTVGQMEPFNLLTTSSGKATPITELINANNDFKIPLSTVRIEGIDHVSQGWCFEEVDIHWMAYAPSVTKNVQRDEELV